MKVFKKVLCLMLVFLTIGCLCACDSGSSSSRSPKDEVRHSVEVMGYTEYWGKSIGGNEIKSSEARVTTIHEVSETIYKVSGKMIMTDIYGTKWTNNFNCTVTYSNGSCKPGNFVYTSNSWSKG